MLNNKHHFYPLLICLLLMLSLLLAACGANATTAPDVPTATSVPPTATTVPLIATPPPTTAPAPTATTVPTTAATATSLPPTTAPTKPPATTVPPTKPPTAAPTAVPTNAPANSGGTISEMQGQLLALKAGTGEVDIRIAAVETRESVQEINAVGNFLIVICDVANVSNVPVSDSNVTVGVAILDNKNRQFQYADKNLTIIRRLHESDPNKYPGSLTSSIQPNTVVKMILVYDVPKDATSFQLVPRLDINKSNRPPSDASFAANGNAGADTGSGAELVGQLISADNRDAKLDLKVKAFERLKEIKSGKDIVSANGIYLIVLLDAASIGKTGMSTDVIALQDDKGRRYEGATTGQANRILRDIDATKYANTDFVQPGFVRQVTTVFDIPADVSNLRLVALDRYKSNRTASSDSFAGSGGSNDSGAGQELVGATVSSKQVDLKVSKVERYGDLKSRNRTVVQTDGVFVVVFFDAENKGAAEQYADTFYLKDDKGRTYLPTTYIGGSFDFAKDITNNSSQLKPGEKATKYAIYEIPKDASGLTLTAR